MNSYPDYNISYYLPQHFLYFLPEPQGQGLFLPTFCSAFTTGFIFSKPAGSSGVPFLLTSLSIFKSRT